MEFIAVCMYPDKCQFMFYSNSFFIDDWAKLQTEGNKMVIDQWTSE